MYAFGHEAFCSDLTPDSVWRLGHDISSSDEELGESLIEFAADLATIRLLPVAEPVRIVRA